MEIMKQAISEWIYSLLGGNPSAAGGPHPPLTSSRGEEAEIPLPGTQRRCWCPPQHLPLIPPKLQPPERAAPACSVPRLPAPASQHRAPGAGSRLLLHPGERRGCVSPRADWLWSRTELRCWFSLAHGKPTPNFPPCSVFL